MNNKQKYDPHTHRRRSIRLKDYDYSKEGAYFITICVRHKLCLFGNIEDEKMILNDAGIMVSQWWQKIPEKFPDVELDVYQIMPNHFHAIVLNTGKREPGEKQSAGQTHGNHGTDDQPSTGQTHGSAPTDILGEHTGSPLHSVVQWFKTMSTNEYIRNVKMNNWEPFDGKLWQRNYWEHIIRNEESYHAIANYIKNNPANWDKDKFFVK